VFICKIVNCAVTLNFVIRNIFADHVEVGISPYHYAGFNQLDLRWAIPYSTVPNNNTLHIIRDCRENAWRLTTLHHTVILNATMYEWVSARCICLYWCCWILGFIFKTFTALAVALSPGHKTCSFFYSSRRLLNRSLEIKVLKLFKMFKCTLSVKKALCHNENGNKMGFVL